MNLNQPPILYMPVPHTGHLPFIAGLPFFMVTLTALGSSLLVRHLTQYMDAINLFSPPSAIFYQPQRLENIASSISAKINKDTCIFCIFLFFCN